MNKNNIETQFPQVSFPKLSVIIPFKNNENNIFQCLDSVINQSLQETQILCLDQGCEDNSFEIIQNFCENDSRITVSSDFDIKEIKGQYVIFLSPENYLEPIMFERLFKKAKATKSDITYCDYSDYDDQVMQKIQSNDLKKEKIPPKHIFSIENDECCEDFFYLIPDMNGCFLYDNVFLNNHSSELFDKFNDFGLSFIMKSSVLATKITFLDAKLLNHHIRNFSPEQLFDDFEKIQYFLQKKGAFFKLQNSFISKWLDLFYQMEKKLPEPEKSVFDFKMIQRIFPCFSDLDKFKKHPLHRLLKKHNFSENFKRAWEDMPESIIPIIIPVDKKEEAYYTAVTIQSILEHTDIEHFYDIYILYADTLTDNLKDLLENLTQKQIRVTCVNIESYLPQNFSPKLARLFACHPFVVGEIFSFYKKVLYLKPQVIVQKNISELFNIDISDYTLAGSFADEDLTYVENDLNLIYETFINTDVLLINPEQWKQNNFTRKCLDGLLVPLQQYKRPIRDILNDVCRNTIYVLDTKYQGQTHLIQNEKYEETDCCLPESFHIINYTDKKPWIVPQEELMGIWWSYARRSPFYEIILFQNTLEQAQKIAHPPIFSSKIPLQIQKVLPKSIAKEEIMQQKNQLYPLLKNYVKEATKYLFSFGKKKKACKEKLQKIIQEISKQINNERPH